MKRFLVIALAVAALVLTVPAMHAQARKATPAPTATPLPPEDPAITTIARKQFVAWQAGIINHDLYTDVMNGLMTPDKVAPTTKALGHLGGLLKAVWEGTAEVDDVPTGSKTYLYHMLCTDGAVYMQFSIEPTGKIAGMLFRDKLTDF